MRILIVLVLFLLLFFSAGFSQGIESMDRPNLKCKTIYILNNSQRIVGEVIDSSEHFLTIVSKKGVQTKVGVAAINRRKTKCKDHSKRPLPMGFYNKISVGFMPTSVVAILPVESPEDNPFGYEPIWSIQHQVAYNFKKGLCLSAGAGMERFFKSYAGYAGGTYENQVYFMNFPVYLGIQKHFRPFRSGHAFVSADYGTALNTQSTKPNHYQSLDEQQIDTKRFFQVHAGWHRYMSKKNALVVGLGIRQQVAEMKEETSIANRILTYTYNRISVQVGLAF